MITQRDLQRPKRREAKEKKIMTTRDVKLPKREELDSEKIKKTKTLTTRDVLPEGWTPKDK